MWVSYRDSRETVVVITCFCNVHPGYLLIYFFFKRKDNYLLFALE
jgi:hypothetical protein